ncbi:MAG: hypothetical protein ACYC6N_09970 [Pirellulaceae bacterium]
MSVVSLDDTSVPASPPARVLQVVNWPVRDDPLSALIGGAICGTMGLVAGGLSASWSMGLLTTLVGMLCLWKLWIPIVCELGPAGITFRMFRFRRHMAWRQIEWVSPAARGVWIGGSEAATRPGSDRNLYLPWRRRPHVLREFHDYYHPTARDAPIKSPGTSPH